jgi:hypothetical protein
MIHINDKKNYGIKCQTYWQQYGLINYALVWYKLNRRSLDANQYVKRLLVHLHKVPNKEHNIPALDNILLDNNLLMH